MNAPERDRLSVLLDDLAHRADGSNPVDRLERVHGRARRTTRLRVATAATVAAVVVVGAAAVLNRAGDVATPQPPGTTAPTAPATPTATAPPTATPTATATPTVSTTASATPTHSLVPADSVYPAAGVCAYATGTVVTVTMNPDVPMPRCLSLHPNQRLRVVNSSALHGSTPVTITVTWAGYAPRVLRPGESTTFEEPAGTYLAVGVHRVHTPPLYGGSAAEVWLH